MNRANRLVIILTFVLLGVCASRAFAGLPGDISADRAVDAVDVQLVINAALDLDIGDLNADINVDALVNAVDVQLVINAALGLVIPVPIEFVSKYTDFSVIAVHDPASAGNCTDCHGERLGELVLCSEPIEEKEARTPACCRCFVCSQVAGKEI